MRMSQRLVEAKDRLGRGAADCRDCPHFRLLSLEVRCDYQYLVAAGPVESLVEWQLSQFNLGSSSHCLHFEPGLHDTSGVTVDVETA